MNWGSPSEFFAMGGHALFVWGSYGAALLAMVAEPWLLSRRRRRALAQVLEQHDEAAEDFHGGAGAPSNPVSSSAPPRAGGPVTEAHPS